MRRTTPQPAAALRYPAHPAGYCRIRPPRPVYWRRGQLRIRPRQPAFSVTGGARAARHGESECRALVVALLLHPAVNPMSTANVTGAAVILRAAFIAMPIHDRKISGSEPHRGRDKTGCRTAAKFSNRRTRTCAAPGTGLPSACAGWLPVPRARRAERGVPAHPVYAPPPRPVYAHSARHGKILGKRTSTLPPRT